MNILYNLKNKVFSKLFPIFVFDALNIDHSINHNIKIIFCKLFKALIYGKKDFLVKAFIDGFWLILPFSHALPRIKVNFPNYDTALPQFYSKLSKSSTYKLKLIDIGANIGDTINHIYNKSTPSAALCIEPSKYYFDLLKLNVRQLENVFCLNAFISDKNDNLLNLVENRGTGTAFLDEINHNSVPNYSLDFLLINKCSTFKNADILKIDTDGWDLKVLTGATDFLKKSRPFIFFEFSPYHYFHTDKSQSSYTLLSFLRKFNYNHFILYDGEGYLLGYFNLNESDIADKLMSLIFDYGLSRSSFYCDLIVAHESKKNFLMEFHSDEINRLTQS